MTLEIRLLGPVEVRRDGQLLRLGGPRQRCLLAFLALQPGRIRTTDAICASLWPDGDLPVDPQQTVRTYVWRLRSSLGGADAVTMRDGGYGLSVDGAEIDMRRFEALLEAASEPGRATEETVELLDEALALWGGPALEGFELEEWARPEALRFGELHAQAIDDRAEAQLELGRHDEAVATLRAGAAESPLRERTHRLLMVALQQEGRQAEALRVYQDYRRRLATDLGLEPGEDIRQLEAAVATGSLPAEAVQRRVLHGYRLFEPLGEGAYAVVYRAMQPSVHREVAMKVIRPALADHPDFVRRFEAEAQLIARLEHPHIVPLYDSWREPGAAYLVMRYFRGGTLEERLGVGPCGTSDAARLMNQIGSALAAAHRAGVVHRDVKPANIFLDNEGNFFLGDFGIASDLRALQEPAERAEAFPSWSMGSVAYASPEQLRREYVGLTSDIHNLGLVLFEALTASRPFSSARTRHELQHHRLHEPLPAVCALGVEVPAGVDGVIARATAKQPSDRYPSVEAFVADCLAALAGEPVREATAAPASWRNPYKGLRAFQEADARDFLGRQRLVDRMLEAMAGGNDRRFLTVVGPSGSGKSSVVRAGLLPRLRAGALPGSEGWFVTSMIPGAHPFEELGAALGRVATRSTAGFAELMTSQPRGMARALERAAPGEDEIVVVVDQLEELFTLCPGDVRAAFIGGLVEAVSEPSAWVRVVATLRADFYDRPLRHPGLAPLVEAGLVTVTPLAPDELESAIVEPARRAGRFPEGGLAAVIAGEVQDQPGALPLLQYALTELFERHNEGVLTMAAYQEIGGLRGAVSRRAEAMYEAAGGDEQLATRRLFTRLVNLGEGTEDTRRRVAVAELVSPPVAVVAERYGRARLLSFDHDPRTRERTVELAHEALIQGWPRLREWLDEDRDGLRLHRDLTARSSAWARSEHDPGELYRGVRLEAAELWATDHPGDLNSLEAEFLTASTAEHRRDVEARRRGARRMRRALVLVAIVAAMALVAGSFAWYHQRRANASASEADRQRDAAQTAEFSAETGRLSALAPTLASTNPGAALLLAVEAEHRGPGPETWGALEQVLVAADSNLGFLSSDVPMRVVQFDGAAHLVGIGTSKVMVWDPETHQLLEARDLPVPVRAPRFDGDPFVPASVGGGELAWVGDDAVARVMSLDSSASTREVMQDADMVLVVPDGKRLVVSTRTGDVQLLQLPDLRPLWTAKGDGTRTSGASAEADGVPPAPEPYYSVPSASLLQLAPDGQSVVVARGWRVRALDLAAGTEVGTTVLALPPGAMAFDLTDPHRLVTLSVHSLTRTAFPAMQVGGVQDLGSRFGKETGLAALPDGRMAVGTDEGQVAIVTLDTGATTDVVAGEVGQLAKSGSQTSSVELLEPHAGKNATLSLSPSGSVLAVGGGTGVSLISVDGSGLIRRAVPRTDDHGYYVGGHDGSWVVTASPPGAAPPEDLHLVRSPARVFECPAASACTGATKLGLDATMELTGDDASNLIIVFTNLSETTGSFRIFDGSTLEPRSVEILPGARFGGWMAIDPHGQWIVLAFNSTISVVDLRTGARLATAPLEWDNATAAVLPSGGILVMNAATGDSLVLDATWTRQPSPIPAGQAAWAAFSPDGRLVATAAPTGDITVRDGRTFAPIRQLSVADQLSPFLPMAFSDDGRFLVTVHPTGGRLWDVATAQLVGQVIPTVRPTAPSAVWGSHVGLLTASQRFVYIWSFDPDSWPRIACQAAGRNLTKVERAQFGPRDQPYHATCPQWPVDA